MFDMHLIFHQVSEESRCCCELLFTGTEFFFTSGIIERFRVSLAIYIQNLPHAFYILRFSRVTKRHRGQECWFVLFGR